MIPSFEILEEIIHFHIKVSKNENNEANHLNNYHDIYIYTDKHDLKNWVDFLNVMSKDIECFDPLVDGCIHTIQYGGFNINIKLL